MKLSMENFEAYQLSRPELVFGGDIIGTMYCTDSVCGMDAYDTEAKSIIYFPS